MADSPADDFSYEVVRRPRRRTIGITVKSDGSVVVAAPTRLPDWRIEILVREKSGWIRKKRQHFQAIAASRGTKEFASGETFELLGKCLTLHLTEGDHDVAPSVWPDGNRLCIAIPAGLADPDRKHWLSEKILDWYRSTALEHLQRRVRQYAALIGVSPLSVGIKSYRSRWGSCHHDGRIYFNWRLVMAPSFVVDYVVVHELSHLLRADHSAIFWRHVESAYPAWREARRWLKEFGHQLDL